MDTLLSCATPELVRVVAVAVAVHFALSALLAFYLYRWVSLAPWREWREAYERLEGLEMGARAVLRLGCALVERYEGKRYTVNGLAMELLRREREEVGR